jgi:hypothetical protein
MCATLHNVIVFYKYTISYTYEHTYLYVSMYVQQYPVDDFLFLAIEGLSARQHFKRKYAKCPPVYRMTMAGACYNLGSHIRQRAAKGVRKFVASHVFGQTKVGQFDVTIAAKHHVFGLNVAVHNAHRMQIPQC